MHTRILSAAVMFALTAGVAPSAIAQSPPPPKVEPGLSLLAITQFPPARTTPIRVTSPAFRSGGDIPFENTQYRGNKFPGLAWMPGPVGTESYVVIMQDADAMVRGAPILHWSMLDIGPGTLSLDAGMTAPPAGAKFGPNIRGPAQAYMGPRTPAGPKHRYHIQVFALNIKLNLDPSATYDALIAAMKLHVVASGELIGLGQIDPNSGQ